MIIELIVLLLFITLRKYVSRFLFQMNVDFIYTLFVLQTMYNKNVQF